MRCNVTLTREPGGLVARCAEYPSCAGRGATRDEALERLRSSLLFWLEMCPCDVTTDSGLELLVTSEPDPPARPH